MAAQTANLDGRGNTVIQIVGDGNAVSAGVRPLWLYRLHRQRRAPRKLLELMVTKLQAVEFAGRDEEIAGIEAWMERPEPLLVQGITGGAGKTRLAIELCGRAEVRGWTAGFADKDELRQLDNLLASTQIAAEARTLLVVDYAQICAAPLRALLVRLVNRPLDDVRLRILVLERHAAAEGGWWGDLSTERSGSEYGLAELFGPPMALKPLAGDAVPLALLTSAIGQARELVKGALEQEDAVIAGHVLARAAGRTPLDLLMAGVAVATTSNLDLAGSSRTDLAFYFAQRELSRIGELESENVPFRSFLVHLALAVTLLGQTSRDDVEALASLERDAIGSPTELGPEDCGRLLAEALPAGGGAVAPILPDLIGEAALVLGLRERSDGVVAGLVTRCFDRRPDASAAAVVRTIQDFVHRTEAPLAWLDAVVAAADGPNLLMTVADALPQATVALRERAAGIDARIAEIYRMPADAGDEAARPILASALNNLAVRLSALGRREEALARAEEATTLYRQLALARPDAFTPGLAMSLSVFGDCLEAVDRLDEALEADEAAIEALHPAFARFQEAFAQPMLTYVQDYVRRCEKGQREPRSDLLMPIVAFLQTAQQSADTNPPEGAS